MGLWKLSLNISIAHKSVSDVTSEVDVVSAHRTEEVVSDLDEDSFVVNYTNVQNAQVKPREKPIPGILKKSSTVEKVEKSEMPNVDSAQASSNHAIKKDNQIQGEVCFLDHIWPALNCPSSRSVSCLKQYVDGLVRKWMICLSNLVVHWKCFRKSMDCCSYFENPFNLFSPRQWRWMVACRRQFRKNWPCSNELSQGKASLIWSWSWVTNSACKSE